MIKATTSNTRDAAPWTSPFVLAESMHTIPSAGSRTLAAEHCTETYKSEARNVANPAPIAVQTVTLSHLRMPNNRSKRTRTGTLAKYIAKPPVNDSAIINCGLLLKCLYHAVSGAESGGITCVNSRSGVVAMCSLYTTVTQHVSGFHDRWAGRKMAYGTAGCIRRSWRLVTSKRKLPDLSQKCQ